MSDVFIDLVILHGEDFECCIGILLCCYILKCRLKICPKSILESFVSVSVSWQYWRCCCWVSHHCLLELVDLLLNPSVHSLSSDEGETEGNPLKWVEHCLCSIVHHPSDLKLQHEVGCLGSVSIEDFRGCSFHSSIASMGCWSRLWHCCLWLPC